MSGPDELRAAGVLRNAYVERSQFEAANLLLLLETRWFGRSAAALKPRRVKRRSGAGKGNSRECETVASAPHDGHPTPTRRRGGLERKLSFTFPEASREVCESPQPFSTAILNQWVGNTNSLPGLPTGKAVFSKPRREHRHAPSTGPSSVSDDRGGDGDDEGDQDGGGAAMGDEDTCTISSSPEPEHTTLRDLLKHAKPLKSISSSLPGSLHHPHSRALRHQHQHHHEASVKAARTSTTGFDAQTSVPCFAEAQFHPQEETSASASSFATGIGDQAESAGVACAKWETDQARREQRHQRFSLDQTVLPAHRLDWDQEALSRRMYTVRPLAELKEAAAEGETGHEPVDEPALKGGLLAPEASNEEHWDFSTAAAAGVYYADPSASGACTAAGAAGTAAGDYHVDRAARAYHGHAGADNVAVLAVCVASPVALLPLPAPATAIEAPKSIQYRRYQPPHQSETASNHDSFLEKQVNLGSSNCSLFDSLEHAFLNGSGTPPPEQQHLTASALSPRHRSAKDELQQRGGNISLFSNLDASKEGRAWMPCERGRGHHPGMGKMTPFHSDTALLELEHIMLGGGDMHREDSLFHLGPQLKLLDDLLLKAVEGDNLDDLTPGFGQLSDSLPQLAKLSQSLTGCSSSESLSQGTKSQSLTRIQWTARPIAKQMSKPPVHRASTHHAAGLEGSYLVVPRVETMAHWLSEFKVHKVKLGSVLPSNATAAAESPTTFEAPLHGSRLPTVGQPTASAVNMRQLSSAWRAMSQQASQPTPCAASPQPSRTSGWNVVAPQLPPHVRTDPSQSNELRLGLDVGKSANDQVWAGSLVPRTQLDPSGTSLFILARVVDAAEGARHCRLVMRSSQSAASCEDLLERLRAELAVAAESKGLPSEVGITIAGCGTIEYSGGGHVFISATSYVTPTVQTRKSVDRRLDADTEHATERLRRSALNIPSRRACPPNVSSSCEQSPSASAETSSAGSGVLVERAFGPSGGSTASRFGSGSSIMLLDVAFVAAEMIAEVLPSGHTIHQVHLADSPPDKGLPSMLQKA